jgi:hypothetical protein
LSAHGVLKTCVELGLRTGAWHIGDHLCLECKRILLDATVDFNWLWSLKELADPRAKRLHIRATRFHLDVQLIGQVLAKPHSSIGCVQARCDVFPNTGELV